MEMISLNKKRIRPKISVHYRTTYIPKENLELKKWKTAYEIVKKSRDRYLNRTIRNLRLSKLFQYIKENLKHKKNKHLRKKSSTEFLRNRWQLARKRGNEFSKQNQYHNFKIEKLPSLYPNFSKERISAAINSRVYGNLVSRTNIERLKLSQKKAKPRESSETDLIQKRRRIHVEYGSYYSMRNKLYNKDIRRQFDNEYQDLLLKCVAFEKEHMEIIGFLEEKFRSDLEFRRGMLALAHHEITNKQENENKTNKGPLVASKEHTLQVIQEEFVPSKEVFVSITRIASKSQSMPIIPSDLKSETFVNTFKYSNHDHQSKLSLEDKLNKTQSEPFQVKSEKQKLDWISDKVTKNAFFEDTILDVMKSYRSDDSDNLKVQGLLSDLYLSFCMNLLKVAINEKFIKDDVDMTIVRDAAVKQADAMSQALDEIFRQKN